jgi:predicted CoA-binding protein
MTDLDLKDFFNSIKTIAIVGLSNNPEKDSYMVAEYLQKFGYRIVPVNPGAEEILGEKCYSDLEHIPFPVDVVDVFRRSEFAPEIARKAVKIKAKTLWLQKGVVSAEAEKIAHEGGLTFVQDDCLMYQRKRLLRD